MFNFWQKNQGDADSRLLRKQLQTFERISNLLISGSSIDESLDEICALIPQVLGVSLVAILLWDSNTKKLNLVKTSIPKIAEVFVESATGRKVKEIVYPTNDKDNAFVKAINEKVIQTEENVEDSLTPLMDFSKAKMLVGLVRTQIKTLVVTPLIVKGEVVGTMALGWKSETLTEDDKGIISTFANQASIGIYNTRLFIQNQRQLVDVAFKNKKLQAINTFTNKIITTLDPEKLIEEALNALPSLFGYAGAIYCEYSKKTGVIRIKAYSKNETSERGFSILGIDPYDIKFDANDPKWKDNLNQKAINEHRTVFSDKFHDLAMGIVPAFISDQIQKTLNITALVAVPVILKGEIIGTMDFIFSGSDLQTIKREELETLLIVTNQITVALENASLYAQVDNALNQLKIYNQQLQEKYQFEKDMMGIMGHELRTPMTVAKGMSELLISKVDKDVAQEVDYFKDKLEKIHTSILKESDLIQTMLSTSHIDNNKMNLQLTKFSFLDLVDYAVMAFKKDAQVKQLEFKYDKPQSLPEMYSDQSRVQEVVTNLISNAIKYTNEGSVVVKIQSDSEFIRFIVKDTGIGIPKDQMQNLGKKFYRVHQYLDDKKDVVRAGGTGLGLYVVKGILDAVGGKLEVNSEEGKGSTFTAVLPINAHPDKDESFVTDRPIDKHDMFEELGFKFDENGQKTDQPSKEKEQ